MLRNIFNMKSTLTTLFILITTLCSFGQNKETDKFIKELRSQKIDSLQTNLLLAWMNLEQSKTGIYDSTFYSNQIIAIGQKEKNTDVEAIGQGFLGYYFYINQNHPLALKKFLKAMQLGEKRNNPRIMLRLYLLMSIFNEANEIKYLQKSLTLAKQTKEINWQIFITLGVGKRYLKSKQYDLALQYLQQAYQMNLQLNRTGKKGFDVDVDILTNLGHVYKKLNNPALALTHYRLGLQAVGKTNTDRDLRIAYKGLATYFKDIKNTDSAFYYSSKYYNLAKKSPSFSPKAQASKMLYEIYKEKGDAVNALKYHEIFKTANDSMFSVEKTKKLESLLMQEKERQNGLVKKRELEKERNKNNLQYSAIAIGLVCFVILFLLVSQTIIVNQKLISFLGTIALLIIFEFLNLLLHPYLGDLTHHSPVFMLLTMVCIAAILIPLHHKIEHWSIHKLVEKNNKIRLEVAKKTIEQLETEQEN